MKIGDEVHAVSRGVDVTVMWVGICNVLVRCACGAEFETPLMDLVSPDDEYRGQ